MRSYGNTSGSGNVGVGEFVLGSNQTGTQLTAIGFLADVNADGYSNSTAIGNQAKITGNNIIQLGNGVSYQSICRNRYHCNTGSRRFTNYRRNVGCRKCAYF